MTEDAPWVGTTPDPPLPCDKSATCPGRLHQIGCEAARLAVLAHSAQQDCLRFGHEYETIMDGNNTPLRLLCTRCSHQWRVVPM